MRPGKISCLRGDHDGLKKDVEIRERGERGEVARRHIYPWELVHWRKQNPLSSPRGAPLSHKSKVWGTRTIAVEGRVMFQHNRPLRCKYKAAASRLPWQPSPHRAPGTGWWPLEVSSSPVVNLTTPDSRHQRKTKPVNKSSEGKQQASCEQRKTAARRYTSQSGYF